MRNKRTIALLLSLLFVTWVAAQTPIVRPELSVPTKIAPAYFGPNAFPVPDMLDGSTSDECKIELYSDSYLGKVPGCKDDFTTNIFLRVTVPLFSPRVNLVLWGNLLEYYNTGPEVNEFRRVDCDGHLTGLLTGDIYVSTDIMLLTQEQQGVDATLRAALKSASGDDYEYARYYDNAAYFFDVAVGREFVFPGEKCSLKLAASTGFLCWQTDNGRQNDAVMYGVKGSLRAGRFGASVEYGGYVGWERDGDAPMTLKANASWQIGAVGVNVGYQVGLMDWPFHQVRIGATYRFSF